MSVRLLRTPMWLLATFCVAVFVAILVGCGGGGGSSSAGSPPPPAPASSPSIATSSLSDAVTGQPYNQQLQASGGTPPYAWSLAAGSQLPAGLALDTNGTISGTPTAVGSMSVSIRVQDAAGRTATAIFTLNVRAPLGSINCEYPNGNVAVNFLGFCTLPSGGAPPFVFGLASDSGPLPPGLTLSASAGQLSGTPTTPGTFTFTLQVRDSASPAQSTTKTLTVVIQNKVVIPTFSLPLGVVSRTYGFTMQAAAGTPPYAWSVSSGTLPPGLAVSTGGVISGTPTSAGFFVFTLRVTDSSSPAQFTEAQASITINSVLTIQTTVLPDCVAAFGIPYVGSVSLQGGTPPYTAQILAGALPAGLSLGPGQPTFNQGFFFAGTCSTTGTTTFTLGITDSSSPPMAAQRDFTIRAVPQLQLQAFSLPEGLEGRPYNASIPASAGVPPYTWMVNSLPPGLILDSGTGQLSGTPTASFDSTVFFTLRDSTNPPQFVNVGQKLRITGLLKITTGQLPSLRQNGPVQVTLDLVGGTPPYTWSLKSGTLPAGLAFDTTTGVISGSPANVESKTVTVGVSDSGITFPQSVERTLTLTSSNTPGRNDSIAAATPLSNGTFLASISPPADPPTATVPNADQDFYKLTATAGAIVTIEIKAQRLKPSSPMNSVIEIVDSRGGRFDTCGIPGTNFLLPCMNDDFLASSGPTMDSRLIFQVPGTGIVEFYVHVLDWRGDARPDMLYLIVISGAN